MKHINKLQSVMGFIDCVEYNELDIVITQKIGVNGNIYYECTVEEFAIVDNEEIVYTYAMFVNSDANLEENDIMSRF